MKARAGTSVFGMMVIGILQVVLLVSKISVVFSDWVLKCDLNQGQRYNMTFGSKVVQVEVISTTFLSPHHNDSMLACPCYNNAQSSECKSINPSHRTCRYLCNPLNDDGDDDDDDHYHDT